MQEPLQRCADMVFGKGATSAPNILVGMLAPPLKMHDLVSKPVEVSAGRSGKMTVLYVFSPECGWCKRNAANMRALVKGAGPKYDVVPISLISDGVGAYVSALGVTGAVYADPTAETRIAYGMGSTPQTIVVGTEGKIVKNWPGAYIGGQLDEISAVLGVPLPGVDK